MGIVPLHNKDTAQSPHTTGDEDVATALTTTTWAPTPCMATRAQPHSPCATTMTWLIPMCSNNNVDTQSPHNHHLGPELLCSNNDTDTQPHLIHRATKQARECAKQGPMSRK